MANFAGVNGSVIQNIHLLLLKRNVLTMYVQIKFEWNEGKASSNLQKHGVSFEEARTVFYDERARLIADPDHSGNEERFVLLGLSSPLRLLVVCHCYRDKGVIRIISARKATKSESRAYD